MTSLDRSFNHVTNDVHVIGSNTTREIEAVHMIGSKAIFVYKEAVLAVFLKRAGQKIFVYNLKFDYLEDQGK